MAASGLLPRAKLLGHVAVNQLGSPCFSRFLSPFCIKICSCLNFSRNYPNTGVLKTANTRFVRHFSVQNWLGIRASDLTEEKINKADVGCPICSRDITFTYKDVLFLSQFMSPKGYILNRRETGVCRKQQRKLEKAIKISQRLGLLPKLSPVLQKELAERKLAEQKHAAQQKA